ncbi:MAG: MoaD/ThiS family protein [Bacillota bacterium]
MGGATASISVQVELQLWLRTCVGKGHAEEVPLRPETVTVQLPPGSTVQDLLNALGLSTEWIGLVVREGKAIFSEEKLQHGDKVTLFPPLSGG